MRWTNWSLDPSLIYVGIAGLLYVLGSRGRCRPRPLQAAAFFAGLLTIVIALDSPIDAYADQLFWVHMLQHILLLTVAPPLILLGRPWPRMWRALPLDTRTEVARAVARAPAGPDRCGHSRDRSPLGSCSAARSSPGTSPPPTTPR